MNRVPGVFTAFLLLASHAGSAAAQRGAVPGADITFTVRPLRPGAGEVTAIEVRSEIRGSLPATPLRFQSPITYASVRDIANRIDSLSVRDSAGLLTLTAQDDPVNRGGFPYYRRWTTDRAVIPPVVVTYRMRPFAGVPVTGPQFDLYAHGGGFSTGGMALFIVPEGLGTLHARVQWDLSQLVAGSIAASTYGEGSVDLTGPIDRVVQSYYMVGALGRFAPVQSGFRAYWLGHTPFDAEKTMAWSQEAYASFRKFHGDTGTATYNVFVRAIPGARAQLGGTALQNSFMLGVVDGPVDTTKAAPKVMIAHEMGHMWIGGISGGNNTAWFGEGLNVYYTRLLLLRAGLISVDEYGRDLNNSANAYYSNPYRNASADSLARLGFSAGVGSGSAQNVPYNRGSLYFADVDAKIRAASNGARRLDDVMLPLLAQRQRGTPLTGGMIIDAIVREIGPSARTQFESVIVRGESIEPISNSFGPCFERHAITYPMLSGPVSGFEWVRVPDMPDIRCRAW